MKGTRSKRRTHLHSFQLPDGSEQSSVSVKQWDEIYCRVVGRTNSHVANVLLSIQMQWRCLSLSAQDVKKEVVSVRRQWLLLQVLTVHTTTCVWGKNTQQVGTIQQYCPHTASSLESTSSSGFFKLQKIISTLRFLPVQLGDSTYIAL